MKVESRDRKRAALWLGFYGLLYLALTVLLVFAFTAHALAQEKPTAADHVVPVLEAFPESALMLLVGLVVGGFLGNLKAIGAWVLVLLDKAPPAHRPVCFRDFQELKQDSRADHVSLSAKLDSFMEETRKENRELLSLVQELKGRTRYLGGGTRAGAR